MTTDEIAYLHKQRQQEVHGSNTNIQQSIRRGRERLQLKRKTKITKLENIFLQPIKII